MQLMQRLKFLVKDWSRLAEQALNSSANFLMSLYALRTLDTESLGIFFTFVCGTQIFSTLVTSRLINERLRLQFHESYIDRGINAIAIISPAIFFTPTLYWITTLLTTHTASQPIEPSFLLIPIFASIFIFEVTRRIISATNPELMKSNLRFSALNLLKCISLGLLCIWTPRYESWNHVFFLENCVIHASAALLLLFFVRTHLCRRNFPVTPWRETLTDSYQSLAWPNIPIAALALTHGTSSLGALAAARTPISFFNPFIEYIDVHRRSSQDFNSMRTATWSFYVPVWFGLTPLVLLISFLLSSISLHEFGSVYEQILMTVLFWWTQLSSLFDRASHNIQRMTARTHFNPNPTSATRILSPIFGTIILTSVFGTIGCIGSMLLWSLTNTLFRIHHRN